MKAKHLKILPILILVAVFSFTVRFADIMSGFSESPGSAMAEEKKEEKPETEEKMTQAPAAAPVDDVTPEEVPAWRDASDQELEFSTSHAEIFEDLKARRQNLEQREKAIVTREALLKAAEQELDRKFQELSNLRGEIENLLTQQSEEETKRLDSLVKIYEGMKPKDAARIFDTLDLDVLVAVMGKMSERRLSPILASMNAERARTITIMLAEQKQLPQLPQ